MFQALPYFSATVKSTKFMEQIVMKMLPHYYLLPELTGQEVSGVSRTSFSLLLILLDIF